MGQAAYNVRRSPSLFTVAPLVDGGGGPPLEPRAKCNICGFCYILGFCSFCTDCAVGIECYVFILDIAQPGYTLAFRAPEFRQRLWLPHPSVGWRTPSPPRFDFAHRPRAKARGKGARAVFMLLDRREQIGCTREDCPMPLRKSPTRTPALLAALRANSRKSTGPRTPRGKARVI